MIALGVLLVAFCAMALLGVVRLVRELLADTPFQPPSMTCETPVAQPEPQQEAAPPSVSSTC
jgi:hypothetical protein